MFSASRFATVTARAALLRAAPVLLLGAQLLSGCGESTTAPPPGPRLVSTLDSLRGRTVYWTTDQPTRGAVRYGFLSGRYDRIAYPPAAGDADKASSRIHAVPLLAAASDETIYARRTDQLGGGELFVAAEETLVTSGVAPTAPTLSFTTIDVQFGDAHVLRLPTAGEVVAIDGGDPGVVVRGETAPRHVMRWIDDHGITRLDVVLATHMHGDHVGGLLEDGAGGPGLLQRYEVGRYLDVPAVSGNEYNWNDVHAILSERLIDRQVIAPGLTDKDAPAALAWDPVVGVAVLNAGAQPEWTDRTTDKINNDSVVLRISYGDVDFITGGDCLEQGEARILANFPDRLAGVEYFKASHHGRYNANSLPYLRAIAPRVAVVPVAFAAYYEGPAQGAADTGQTLGRLASLGADVFRFDAALPLDRAQDNVTFWHTTFITDGVSYEVHIEPSVWGL